jgi:hypothetical protein
MDRLMTALVFITLLLGLAAPSSAYEVSLDYKHGTFQAVTIMGGLAYLSDLIEISVTGDRHKDDVVDPSNFFLNSATGSINISDSLGTFLGTNLDFNRQGYPFDVGQVSIGGTEESPTLPEGVNPYLTSAQDAPWKITYGLQSGNWIEMVSFYGRSAGIAFDAANFNTLFYGTDILVTFINQISLKGQLQDNLYESVIFDFIPFPGLRQLSPFEFSIGTRLVTYDGRPSHAPLPSTLLLLGTGILGLGTFGWRRRGKE